MIKIGLIGTDGGTKNGHALKILECLSSANYNACVTHLYGDVSEERDALKTKFNIGNTVSDVSEMFGQVDAVMVVQRNGALHAKSALLFIQKGYPVFIDKPFACRVEDAELMVRLGKN